MTEKNILWTEKYRPKSLDEIVGHKYIVEKLKSYVKNKNMPNLIFTGPPGTGKTACALALAYELYGENIKRNFLDLNASDARGIDVVRHNIKEFAATLPYDAPFKIIFLDEADALTADAQNALRRIMEDYAENTRFILSCNLSSKIIPPIQSRCVVFRFKRLSKEEVIERLKYIAEKEGLEITDDAFEAIYDISEGDMRKAINLLQGAAMLNKKITYKEIYETSSLAQPEDVRSLIEFALNGNFLKAREKLDYLLFDQGVGGEEILNQIYKEITKIEGIDDYIKAKIIDRIGEIDFRLIEGASERIQLESLVAYLCLISKEY